VSQFLYYQKYYCDVSNIGYWICVLFSGERCPAKSSWISRSMWLIIRRIRLGGRVLLCTIFCQKTIFGFYNSIVFKIQALLLESSMFLKILGNFFSWCIRYVFACANNRFGKRRRLFFAEFWLVSDKTNSTVFFHYIDPFDVVDGSPFVPLVWPWFFCDFSEDHSSRD